MDAFNMAGKAALVTGSSRGIGRAIATAYARAGAKVVITSRKIEACKAVVDALHAEGLQAIAVACNVSIKEQVESLCTQAEAAFGHVDVLVCNAAVNPYYGPMSAIPDDAFAKVLQVNVVSPVWLVNRLAPGMARHGGGSVVLISSIAGLTGSRVLGAYAVSKQPTCNWLAIWRSSGASKAYAATASLPAWSAPTSRRRCGTTRTP